MRFPTERAEAMKRLLSRAIRRTLALLGVVAAALAMTAGAVALGFSEPDVTGGDLTLTDLLVEGQEPPPPEDRLLFADPSSYISEDGLIADAIPQQVAVLAPTGPGYC